MNNFSKDELEDLLFCVKDHTGYQGDSIHNHLINKIQSMIDNYCEHNFIGYAEGRATFPYCNKCCKVILNDNQ